MRLLVIVFSLCLLTQNTAFAHGDVHEQITALTNEIAASTEPARLLLLRAELYRIDGDYKAAEADVMLAREKDPKLGGLYWIAARIAHDQKNYTKSREYVTLHLAQQPKDSAAYVLQGTVCELLGDDPAARKSYEQVLAMQSSPDPEIPCRLALLIHRGGDAQAAKTILDRYEATLGNVPIYIETALHLDLERGEHTLALQRIDKQIARSPRPETWYVMRGDLLHRLGDDKAARSAYDAALTAINSLPLSRRTTPSMNTLQARIHLSLQELP